MRQEDTCRAHLYDVDGNVLLDFQNNYTSLIYGHRHKPAAEVVQQILNSSGYIA